MPMKRSFYVVLHPMKLAENLTRSQCALLVETIKDVLAKAITQGGTTLKISYSPMVALVILRRNCWCTETKINLVQNVAQRLKGMIIGQRNSFYCPHCQKKK